MVAQLQEVKDELTAYREEKKARDASKQPPKGKARPEAPPTPTGKLPWAFSPSGRWRPGLWQGALDRSQPCHHGEPAHSIAFVENKGPEWSDLLLA